MCPYVETDRQRYALRVPKRVIHSYIYLSTGTYAIVYGHLCMHLSLSLYVDIYLYMLPLLCVVCVAAEHGEEFRIFLLPSSLGFLGLAVSSRSSADC